MIYILVQLDRALHKGKVMFEIVITLLMVGLFWASFGKI